jgi:MFS transporter, PAT family, beta-lactamase induction signal transducer AmpG
MILVAAILVLAAVYHYYMLPPGSKAPDAATNLDEALRSTGKAWATFFRKPRVWLMIAAVFFYRFGEGFIEKIGPLFLKDPRTVGGLGLDNMVLGSINAIGTVVFIAGTMLGGFMAARLTLRRVFVLLAFCLNVPLFTYYFLSLTMPTSATLITGVVLVEKFGYGMGTVGLMLYMMQEVSPGPYRTAHYAFATGIMALTMQLTGMVSGYVQSALHYPRFFLAVLLAAMATIVLAWIAPFGANPDAEQPVKAAEPAAS